MLPRAGIAESLPSGINQLPPVSGRLPYFHEARRVTERLKPDWVFCGHIYMAAAARHVANRTGAKLWLQIHGIEAWGPPHHPWQEAMPGSVPNRTPHCLQPWRRRVAERFKGWRRSWLGMPLAHATRKAADSADRVTLVSRYSRSRFLSWAKVAPHRATVLPDTVSERFNWQGDRKSLRQKLALPEGKVLLTVARMSSGEQYKGQDRVIRALPAVAKLQPDIQYWVAGSGDDQPRLAALAKQFEVEERVHFLGRVSNADLPALYRTADLFVMPSTGEGFGISFLEAMACGTPALGLDQDASRDPLQDGGLGIVANPVRLVEGIIAGLTAVDAQSLAQRTEQLFGRQAFQSQVDALFQDGATAAQRERQMTSGAQCAA